MQLTTRSFWREAVVALAVATAFTLTDVAPTSCAWHREIIDIGSGAGYFTGSMETYDMSNGASAEQEEEYNDDFFYLPRDPWAARARRDAATASAAAAGRAAPRTSPLAEAGEWNPSPMPLAIAQVHQPYQRGLDAGLARAMPVDFDGRPASYRDYRRRLTLFQRLCERRGADCVAEGALTLLQCLPAKAWDATKHLDLALVESTGGFGAILSALDKLYQYDDTVEAPARCAEYFEKFARRNDETLNEYEVREREVRTRLRDVGVIVPELVAGWIVLSRAGIPQWQEPNVRAICRGKLTPEGVHDALKQLFGGDHKPERRDARRAGHRAQTKGGEAYAAEDWDDEWYAEDD